MIKIKEARKSKKITAKKLAEEVNVAESTMSLYENGKREPDFSTLLKIADRLEISVDELLGRTTNSSLFTQHEQAVIAAYRKHPSMQEAVDKLLGIHYTQK